MNQVKRYVPIGALLIVALLFPLVFPDPAVTSIAVFALLYAGAASGWNIFSGYTGYLSLGHSAYFGLGAYSMALLCQWGHVPGGYRPFLLLPLVWIVVVVVAVPLGLIALRVRRFTFITITIAILFIFQVLAYNLQNLTGGTAGLYLPLPPWSGDVYNLPFYYVALALVVLSLVVSWAIRRSRFGLGLLAIRDDEDRALGLGIQTTLYKILAYVISAVFVGSIGAVSAYLLGFINPPFAFAPIFDVTITLMTLFGGIGTVMGPILGALLIESCQLSVTSQVDVRGLNLILIGVLLLLVLLFLPRGIIPSVRNFWSRRRAASTNEKSGAMSTKAQRGKRGVA